jgi:NAD(P)-dependent dehydrogenase (short-subunit alcohol dehydrogenase family)
VTAGLRAAGHHVVMACRSMERCAVAKAELDAPHRGLPGSCECRQLDLADFASIRRLAAELTSQEGNSASKPLQLATLVNNAGVMGVPPTPAGGCGHWRPNHLGPFLLTRLLLPAMAAGSRVVTVASEAHHRGTLSIGPEPPSTSGSGASSSNGTSRNSSASQQRLRLEPAGPGRWWYADYARSKLGNVLMTAELSRRLQQRGSTVTCSSVSPGRVNTGIYGNVPGILRPALRWLAAAVFQTPEQGAGTVLLAALSPELEGRHELYMHAMQPSPAAPAARDPALAAQLWQLSVQDTGLSAAEDAALWPPY